MGTNKHSSRKCNPMNNTFIVSNKLVLRIDGTIIIEIGANFSLCEK